MFNPVSTYRIQFNKDFTFSHFEKTITYLVNLGVKTIYASPVFEAAPGSTHGYDGTNPLKINPEIGTKEQLEEISKKLRDNNVSWIQDIVPNHLAFHENNEWLMDVLEKGKDSAYASYFDVIWDHPDHPDRLMVPFPGSSLEHILKQKFPGEKNYVLVPWQETDRVMNYRRFFLVNSLICTNIHVDEVFSAYHAFIKELVHNNIFQGLRVDHIDGLYDPTKYLNDLRKLSGDDTYIVVEKILEPGEDMPLKWPIQGNSGYDFLGIVNNLFSNRRSEYALAAFYFDVTGNGKSVEQQIREKKSYILFNHMGGELDNLVRLYRKSVEDTNDQELKQSIAEYLISCPVYRYYDDDFAVMERDRNKDRTVLKEFYSRCMQFTGPLMAKGVEDTLMYTYNRFIGHNEVGDSPDFFGYETNKFHDLMLNRNIHWPLSMNASSTHDTKRGEDVRARLNAVTDLHEEWIGLVKNWMEQNNHLKTNNEPDKNDEYFIYQTLIGSHPMISPNGVDQQEQKNYPIRLAEYLQKSLREAKIHSNWTEPNAAYEKASIDFCHQLLEINNEFSKTFLPFFRKVSYYGVINSLGQLLLKFTCPGIPDIYQGTELWDLSLVDPDNRRPVDFDLRIKMSKANKHFKSLWKTRWNGNIKLALLQKLLEIRNKYNDTFQGEYLPLTIEGTYRKNVIAYIRRNNGTSIMSVVPLHFATMHSYDETSAEIPQADWQDTKIILPPGDMTKWEDLLNGGSVVEGELSMNKIFQQFPLALLKSK
jgi:maltooligosyltrehalose synthase